MRKPLLFRQTPHGAHNEEVRTPGDTIQKPYKQGAEDAGFIVFIKHVSQMQSAAHSFSLTSNYKGINLRKSLYFMRRSAALEATVYASSFLHPGGIRGSVSPDRRALCRKGPSRLVPSSMLQNIQPLSASPSSILLGTGLYTPLQ